MATLAVTANAGQVLRLVQTLTAVAASASENKNITFTIDDSDLSIQYTDGIYGTQTKKHK
jgi:hypothetical protein